MGKRETKESYEDTKKDKAETKVQYATGQAESKERSDAMGGLLGDDHDYLENQYKNMGSGSLAGTAQQMAAPRAIDVSDLKDTLGQYKTFRDTGGLSAENIDRMRGMGGFDEFAKTGGYTPESIANIKAQALSPIGSYATGTRDNLARSAATSNGYTPGYDAANRQLSRDTARQIANTSLDANVGIQDRINTGRQWGISGLTGAEKDLATLQTGNRLNALGGETTVGNYISGYDAQNVGNEMQVDQYNTTARTNTDLNNQQNANLGMGALQNLYNTDQATYQTELDRRNSLLGGQTTANLNYLTNQSDLGKQPGIGGNLVSLASSAAGIGGMMMTGGATAAIGAGAKAAKS